MSYEKTLIILTEGGKNLGFGHITRTISVANEFLNCDFKVKFIINADNSVNDILKSYNYLLSNWNDDFPRLIDEISHCSLILIDSILITNEQIKQLENTNIPIIFLDDDKRRNILDKGYVVDWTILSETKEYFIPKKQKVKYLLGASYTSLRSGFNSCKKHIIQKQIKSIMVTFGGSDIQNLTPKILKMLNIHYPNIAKNIIIGNGFDNISKIEQLKTKNTNLIYNASSDDMIALMQNSDIAIASGGQTLYEMVLVGIPTLSILLVDNAKDDTICWDSVEANIYVSEWNDEDILNKLQYNIDKIQDIKLREYLQQNGWKHLKSNGAKKLVKEIVDDII